MKFSLAAALLTSSIALGQNLYIPQIADGGGWQTTLVLTNAGTSAATASLTFYLDVGSGNTQPWNLSFVEGPAQGLNIPAGDTILLHTLGTAGTTAVGWGAVNAGAGVTAYAIFTQRAPGRQDQDGTAPAAALASRFLAPFDETNGAVVGIAIANGSPSAQTVSVAVRTAAGNTATGSMTIPGNGHFAFALQDPGSPLGSVLAAAVSGESGLAEFYTTTATLSIITLRFNKTLSFTAAPVYAEGGPAVIGPPLASSAPPFSGLFVSGVFTVGGITSPGLFLLISPDGSGTYTAYVLQVNQPSNLPIGLFAVAVFTRGSLSGQHLAFNSGAAGVYYGSQVVGGSISLTVNNFTQPGSAASGTLTFVTSNGSMSSTTTTGAINFATSTYEP